MSGLIQWVMQFVQQGSPFYAFTISGALFVIGLALGLRAEMRAGWALAVLSLAYIALRLYTIIN